MISDWKAHFQRIYRGEARTYQRMVSAEDAHGEPSARVAALAASVAKIADIGAGTGRLTVPLCIAGNMVHGVDTAPAMLDVARTRLAHCPRKWVLSTADARELHQRVTCSDRAVSTVSLWLPSASRSAIG